MLNTILHKYTSHKFRDVSSNDLDDRRNVPGYFYILCHIHKFHRNGYTTNFWINLILFFFFFYLYDFKITQFIGFVERGLTYIEVIYYVYVCVITNRSGIKESTRTSGTATARLRYISQLAEAMSTRYGGCWGMVPIWSSINMARVRSTMRLKTIRWRWVKFPCRLTAQTITPSSYSYNNHMHLFIG